MRRKYIFFNLQLSQVHTAEKNQRNLQQQQRRTVRFIYNLQQVILVVAEHIQELRKKFQADFELFRLVRRRRKLITDENVVRYVSGRLYRFNVIDGHLKTFLHDSHQRVLKKKQKNV